MNDILADIAYWSNKLTELSDEAMKFQTQLAAAPHSPLSIEDSYKMRQLLLDYVAYSDLLADCVAALDELKSKTPFWKKFFQK